MSFVDEARVVALGAAGLLRTWANSMGVLRSVDATKAAELVHSIADDIFLRLERQDLTRQGIRAERSRPKRGAPPRKTHRAKSSGALYSPHRGENRGQP